MRILLALVLFLLATLSQAASTLLSGGQITELADGSQLVFDLSGPTAYRSFMLANPPRFVVDLKNTTGRNLRHRLRSADVQGVRTGSRDGRDLRVVVDLRQASFSKATILDERDGRLVLDIFRHRPPVFEDPGEVAYVTPPRPSPRPITPVSVTLPSLELLSQTALPVAKASVAIPQQPRVHAQTATPQPQLRRRDILIAIDPGHGGKDPGAVGPNGTREKNVVLAIARRLERLIDARDGMQAFLTRDRDVY
ncbi:MAG: N-acetylmuramoyl-L-alanine amidase, partial [Candidatus Competibacterales bacterium]|nr:N-acetylmuramoyl-L-alanine amidase [Candidatus Competibacterales bacterium]